MKLAFLISADRDAEQLRRLVSSLPEGSTSYIHIDGRVDTFPFTQQLRSESVHFIDHRVKVVRGSISEVEVQVELLREALRGDADYLVALSPNDYPLWPNSRIVNYFEEARADYRELLQGIPMVGQGQAAEPYRIFRFLASQRWHRASPAGIFRATLGKFVEATPLRKTLRIHCVGKTYNLYKGSTDWALSHDVAQRVVNEWDQNAHLVGYFSTSYRPVETFVPTVVFNSGFSTRCLLAKGKYTGQSLEPLAYIAPNGKTLTELDYPTLKQTDQMLFRRVASGISDRLMAMVDRERAAGHTAQNATAAQG